MTPDEVGQMLTARQAEWEEARQEFVRDLARDPLRQAERRERGMASLEQLAGYVPPERVGDVVRERTALAKLRAGMRILSIEDLRRYDVDRARVLAELARYGRYLESPRPDPPVFGLP